MKLNEILKQDLEEIREIGRYRERKILSEGIIDFSSNDYLGLKDNQQTKKLLCKNLENLSLGCGASVLISGYTEIQKELEKTLSSFKETEKCIVVGSGYLANTGLIPAITTEQDVIFSDEYNHASIIDGIRLSKAKRVIYKHNDMNDLEDKLKKNIPERLPFIITDGVFSMEGDIAPLKDIVYLAKKYNCVVIIDDAHSTGILGEGKGTLFHYGLKPDENIIQVGTLSKAVGSYGAFICGSETLIDFLINKMRTGIFSTGLSPVQNFISLNNLRILIEDNYRRENLFEKTSYLHRKLKEAGIEINFYGTPILTYIVGDDKTALEIRDKFLENGIFIQAIRPPTVPEGTARLRITLSYKHKWKDIEKLIKIFKNLYSEVCHG